ncbi:MAG: RidA family protein [Anaerolineales bacterium]
MTPEDRLRSLDLELPPPPIPVASYSLSVRAGDLLFLSGTTCYLGGKPMYTGKVGGDLSTEQGQEAARQTALNLLSVLRYELGDLGRVAQVVKVNGYVNSAPGFVDQPAVMNGVSDLLLAVFGEPGRHARTSIGVAELPGNIPIEVEMIVRVGPRPSSSRAGSSTKRTTARGRAR